MCFIVVNIRPKDERRSLLLFAEKWKNGKWYIYKSACSYVTRVRVLIIYKETMQTKRRKMTTMAKQMNKECSMEWNPTRDNESQRQHNPTKTLIPGKNSNRRKSCAFVIFRRNLKFQPSITKHTTLTLISHSVTLEAIIKILKTIQRFASVVRV